MMRLLPLVFALTISPELHAWGQPSPISGRCGDYAVFVALHYDPSEVEQHAVPTDQILPKPITFWIGPFKSAVDARAVTRDIAMRGSWGSTKVDGFIFHGHYDEEFYPHERIVRTYHVVGCVR